MTFGSMAVSFIYIGRIPFLAQILDNALYQDLVPGEDPLFTLVLTSGFSLHDVVVVDYGPASSCL